MKHIETSYFRQHWLKRKWFWISCAIFVTLSAYLIWDYNGPREISLKTDNVMGIPVLRVKDEELIVQEYDSEGNLWVTRGMWAYQLQPGSIKFVRQYHIPTGVSIFWLRNFSVVRRLTLRPECVELLPMPSGKALAMSAGRMWYRPSQNEEFEEKLVLRHYGIGIGQGIRNDGWDKLNDGTILFGEFFMNKSHSNVRLYSSADNGKTWQVAFEFPSGRIRHVHAVQQDPFKDKAWILTGDRDKESMVAWTDDGGKTLTSISQGNQKSRVTQLAFTEDALFWGADTRSREESGIYRWDRKTRKLTKLASAVGVIMYVTRLASGTIVMSANIERSNREKDAKTRLWILIDGKKVNSMVFGTRASRRKFAKLRFQRRQGNDSLVISILNHREYNNDLLIISEESLKAAAYSNRLRQ